MNCDDGTVVSTQEQNVSGTKAPNRISKTFRSYDQDQMFLMPPSLDDWLPEGHSARFISEVVDECLDLSVIYDSYAETSGAPPYNPAMMLKLLLYAYSTGVTSSREMERRCYVDVAFRWLSTNTTPDYRSLSRFRRRHEGALGDLFNQVLVLCGSSGLVKLGRVALDGTKLRASASKHKAMSYERLGPRIEELQAQVLEILKEAEATDAKEDGAYGANSRGDELPEELRYKESRLVKMRAAKEAIEAEAKAKERASTGAKSVDKENSKDTTVTKPNTTSLVNPKAQRSFTDPDASMMKTNEGFHYAYNAQVVVDEESQVILTTKVTQSATDINELIPMVEATKESLEKANLTRSPRVYLADAGYCSEANLTYLTETKVTALIATGRFKHNKPISDSPRGRIPTCATRRERMARSLRTKSGRRDYARRKVIVEPVFGQIKVKQRAGNLRLRGVSGAQLEWILHSICHNLRKLSNAKGNQGLAVA